MENAPSAKKQSRAFGSSLFDSQRSKSRFLLALMIPVMIIASSAFSLEEVNELSSNYSKKVRGSAVAGSFYPAEPALLRSQIEEFLSSAAIIQPPGRIMAIVSPHAGYIYSGLVAAHAYKLLEKQDIHRVIIISPSHVEFFPFASVFSGEAYRTPLGDIIVDRTLVDSICAGQDLVKASDRGHMQADMPRQEHALEVQLPFLQEVLDDFTIVPIVMGDQNWRICEALGKTISPLLKDPGTLVVASSDLSHFHDYDEARRLDSGFCRALEKLDAKSLYDGIKSHDFEACGAGPVISALIAARSAGAGTVKVLSQTNSGDVTGDKSSVVGYASAAIIAGADDRPGGKAKSKKEFNLSLREKKYLLALARKSIADELNLPAVNPGLFSSPTLSAKCGAFVTLKIGGSLRGCIGYIEAVKPLNETIIEMAQAAAFRDPRFPPLGGKEYPAVSIEISVLSPLYEIDNIENIIVGRDGLVIEKGFKRGLLLPQVAVEYNWDRKEFLQHTCRKAMLQADAWKDPNTTIYAFSAIVFGE